MHQPFSNSFASLVECIVARSPDSDLWLPLNSLWRKPMICIFSPMGVVWYLVPSWIVAWIRFQFGLLHIIRSS